MDTSVAAARAAIAAAVQPVAADDEVLPLAELHGRILAADLVSPIDVPAHDNAAMDGYAYDGGASGPLTVAGTAVAGAPFGRTLPPGECLRVMTGAVMPAGADTVLAQEDAQLDDCRLVVAVGALRRGSNRRCRGEDLARGQTALVAGRRLKASDVGLVASLGIARLAVRRRLRVALFSTGDELREPGAVLDPGCIYDSNRASLRAALQALGCDVIDLGRVADAPAALQDTLQAASERADAIVTSGGVSAGDADHVRAVLARMGSVAFWRVAMRPGRPFAFGRVGNAWLFALPGNPVAALVGFHVLVRDALLRLAGAQPAPLPAVLLPCTAAMPKRPGRAEFARGVVATGHVTPGTSQGSGILRSMSEANALIVLDAERGPVAAGETVEVWLLDAAG